jgi:hypothetical protein
MSLAVPLPCSGPAPVRAASWLGGWLSSQVAARLPSIATPCDARAGTGPAERGRPVDARIVSLRSQDQGAFEADLAAFAPSSLDLPQAEVVHRLVMLIRVHVPRISGATHLRDLRIVENGALEGNA